MCVSYLQQEEGLPIRFTIAVNWNIVIYLGIVGAPTCGEQQDIISVCDLLANRMLYDNKGVTVRGAWVVSAHASTLQPADGFCKLPPDVKHSKVWLLAEPGAPTRPIRPGEKEDYKSDSIARRMWAKWGWVAVLNVKGTFENAQSWTESTSYKYLASGSSGLLKYKSLGDPVWIKITEHEARMMIPDSGRAKQK
jgi:hypothetical protein